MGSRHLLYYPNLLYTAVMLHFKDHFICMRRWEMIKTATYYYLYPTKSSGLLVNKTDHELGPKKYRSAILMNLFVKAWSIESEKALNWFTQCKTKHEICTNFHLEQLKGRRGFLFRSFVSFRNLLEGWTQSLSLPIIYIQLKFWKCIINEATCFCL